MACVLKLLGRARMPFLAWELLMLPAEPALIMPMDEGRSFKCDGLRLECAFEAHNATQYAI